MSKFWPKGGLAGILHHYTETLTTFEYTSPLSKPQPHSILFVGGLGDGLATTSYMADVVRALGPTDWSLFTLTLTGSYQSWGIGHLDRDTDEIATCLDYIKAYKKEKYGSDSSNDDGERKIVLMGHSTGSQCVVHYLHKPNPHTSPCPFDPYLEHVTRPVLDGAIMQAPVSDRHAVQWVCEEGIGSNSPEKCQAAYAELKKLALAAETAASKNPQFDTMLPIELTSVLGYPVNTPLSARRFLSLVSPSSPNQPSEDDLFSNDISDAHLATTFGQIKPSGLLKTTLMVLYSGADQSVPAWVDKGKLMGRWADAADHGGKYQVYDREWSAIIPGASHALSNDDQAEARAFLCRKVLGYLDALLKKSA